VLRKPGILQHARRPCTIGLLASFDPFISNSAILKKRPSANGLDIPDRQALYFADLSAMIPNL
jgi:hypothetical protein